ncbi:MAG TPA: ABC transporter ATP-binding protein [Candidatus Lokiarchaeia archaeon]|nr:ABC transporter ATP-binding protein [Candidatus Lokiarchaeia archaeon]
MEYLDDNTTGDDAMDATRANDDDSACMQGLIIENLVKVYKTGTLEVQALRGLSMKIPLGKIVVIMGPSGCGKTTLLNLIGGLDIPTAGKIQFRDQMISNMSINELELFRRKFVGFIFQFMNLVPILNAAENVALPLRIAGLSSADIKKRVFDLLEIVNLKSRMKHRPDELSGGEQQRVAIASAMANDPQILLCDEPTGELDSENKHALMTLFVTLINRNPDKIILIVTHDAELQQIADIVLYIKDGVIVDQIEGKELAANIDSLVHNNNKAKNNLSQLRELKKMIGEISKRIDEIEGEF